MGYCQLDDVYTLALAAPAFVVRPRPFDAADAASATIRVKAHGASLLDVILFEVTEGGTLPTGISAFLPYYPLPVSSDLLRVSLTSGGPAIPSWVTVGEGWGIVIDPVRRILAHIEQASAEIDEDLTADQPPLLVDATTGKFPQQIIGLCARMAARAAVNSLQILENAAYRTAVDRLFEKEKTDNEMRARWRSGKPLNPRPTDGTTTPDNGAIASSDTSTGWRSGRL